MKDHILNRLNDIQRVLCCNCEGAKLEILFLIKGQLVCRCSDCGTILNYIDNYTAIFMPQEDEDDEGHLTLANNNGGPPNYAG